MGGGASAAVEKEEDMDMEEFSLTEWTRTVQPSIEAPPICPYLSLWAQYSRFLVGGRSITRYLTFGSLIHATHRLLLQNRR